MIHKTTDIDKDEFAALLSDTAAQPDAAFVAALENRLPRNAKKPTERASHSKHFVMAGMVSAVLLSGLFASAGLRTTIGVESTLTADVPTVPRTVGSTPIDGLLESGLQPTDNAGLSDQSADVQRNNGTQSDAVEEDAAIVVTDQGTDSNGDNMLMGTDMTFEIDVWSIDPSTAVQDIVVPLGQTPDIVLTTAGPLTIDQLDGLTLDGAEINEYYVLRAQGEAKLAPGQYAFNVTADDGVRIYVDDELLVDRWSSTEALSEQVVFDVDPDGEVSTIVVEYYQLAGAADLSVFIEPLL